MADTKKPRPTARAPAGKAAPAPGTESKAAAEFQRFKAARAAAAASEGSTTGATPSSPSLGASGFPPPMVGLPPWPMPPQPQPPQGWDMQPQPGVVQPAPLAVGPLGDRLGSTLRLGIDVINMALAGSLRLLGGMGYGGHEYGCGSHYGYESHCFAEHYGGSHNCCCAFEQEDCCTPSVGSCCN